MLIEHAEWVGCQYAEGIQGQHIAIMGFSHWGDVAKDHIGFTRQIIQGECDGDGVDPIDFFAKIQRYFSYDSARDFWGRVIFFNFIPDMIGSGEERFARGTPKQHKRGCERFLQIIGRQHPEKVVVFSSKAWALLPLFRKADPKEHRLGPEFPATRTWGTYEQDGHVTTAFGLRHTQGATTREMTQAVRRILGMSVHRAGQG